MASTEVSIKQLPTISSIESGNFIIVQTENSTNKLDFKDFVIGLENTTFANTVNEGTTGVDELSSVLYGSPTAIVGPDTGLSGIPITISGTTYLIMLSAIA
jgi:hypothetical protein